MGGGGRSRHLGNDFGVVTECESEFGKLNCWLTWLYVGGGGRWTEGLGNELVWWLAGLANWIGDLWAVGAAECETESERLNGLLNCGWWRSVKAGEMSWCGGRMWDRILGNWIVYWIGYMWAVEVGWWKARLYIKWTVESVKGGGNDLGFRLNGFLAASNSKGARSSCGSRWDLVHN